MIKAEMYNKIYYAIALITSKMVEASTNLHNLYTTISGINKNI